MIEIFVLFLVTLIGIRIGWTLREYFARESIKKLLENNQLDIQSMLEEEPEQPKNVIKVLIEEHNGQFFAYNIKDNSFMAQAQSFPKLQDNLVQRFPNNKFIISEENLKKVGVDYESF